MKYDGIAIKGHPAMAEFPRNSAEAGRFDEPRIIMISPGLHSYDVEFSYLDMARGLAMSEMAKEMVKKYNHKSKGDFVVIVHNESIEFYAEKTGYYFVSYVWDNEAIEIRIIVKQCDAEKKKCSDVPFISKSAATRLS